MIANNAYVHCCAFTLQYNLANYVTFVFVHLYVYVMYLILCVCRCCLTQSSWQKAQQLMTCRDQGVCSLVDCKTSTARLPSSR
jgi:hypothetical protein